MPQHFLLLRGYSADGALLPKCGLVPNSAVRFDANWPPTKDATMTATENIFLAWALFSGGVTLIIATLILLFDWAKHSRFQ
jgi:hypothetical protein